jgi:methyltransferase (TIGR00027 family)
LEADTHYRSDDYIAPLLIPGFIKPVMRISLLRRFFTRKIAPKGIYEYVVARTKYLDAVFEQALAERFDQILIFGAGFDTRALRFQDKAQNSRIYELDVSTTQQAKIRRYQERNLTVPPNVRFVAIDFDKELLPAKLDEAGFGKQKRSLFILEGLLMYLQPASVDATFQTIQDYAGRRSLVAFDHIYASVLRNEGTYAGESEIAKTVSKADEKWHFGIEKEEIKSFLGKYDLRLINQKDSRELEKTYFSDSDGRVVANINGTHCLVTAEKM